MKCPVIFGRLTRGLGSIFMVVLTLTNPLCSHFWFGRRSYILHPPHTRTHTHTHAHTHSHNFITPCGDFSNRATINRVKTFRTLLPCFIRALPSVESSSGSLSSVPQLTTISHALSIFLQWQLPAPCRMPCHPLTSGILLPSKCCRCPPKKASQWDMFCWRTISWYA